MPKLSQLIPESGGAVAPYPQASPAAFAGGLAGGAGHVGRAIEGALDTYAQAVDQRAKLEASKQKVLDETDAAERMSRLELDYTSQDLALRRTTVDPQAYLDQSEAIRKETQERILEGASPGTRQILSRRIPEWNTRSGNAARSHGDALFVGSREAALVRTLDNLEKQAGLADPTDVDAIQRQDDQLRAALGGQVTVIGPKKAEELLIKARARFAAERARRHTESDPDGAIAELTTPGGLYQHMDPTERDRQVDRARTLKAAATKDAEARWEKFYKQVEEEAEAERQGQLTTFSQQIYAKKATLADLDNLKAMRVVQTRQEYEHYYKLLTDTKDAPSNQAVLQDIDVRLNEAVPRVTQRELAARYQSGDLNERDYNQRATRLTQRLDHMTAEARANRAEGRAIENHAEATRNKSITEGRRMIDGFFGITGPFDSLGLSDEKRNLHYLATEEYANRVLPERGGKEQPATVADDILTRMRPTREAATRVGVDKLRQTLRYPTPAALDQAASFGQISKTEYDRQRRIFLDIEKAEALEAGQGTGTKGGAGAKGGGKSTMGRTSTTPVETSR